MLKCFVTTPPLAWTITVLVVLVASPVLGFSSGRSSSSTHTHRSHVHQPQKFSLDSSEEDEPKQMVNELRHEVTDPQIGGGGGLNSIDDVMNNVVAMAEDLAEEASKKCHAMRFPIDYDALKNDFLECSKKVVTQITTQVVQTSMAVNLRQSELESVQQSVLLEQPLTLKQKQFLTNTIFEPVCTTLVPAMSECDDPKYTTLTQASQCKPDYEKDGEELFKTAVNDLCRNNGAWIFDYLESKPTKCANELFITSRTEEHQQRLLYLRGLEVDKKRPGKSRRLESQVEFCNITETVGVLFSDLLITSCPEHPRPGQILLNTFRDTQNFWNAKCGSGATATIPAAGWWPLLIFCLLAIVKNWSQNLEH